MTYNRLKSTTSALLRGDTELTSDDEELLGLLEMAFNDVATHAQALHLLTMNRDGDILRIAQGEYLIRTPKLPVEDTEELDIDNELCFAVARLLASYTSDSKSAIHFQEAKRIIQNYNSKIFEILETIKEQEDGSYDISPTNYS